MLKAVPSRRNRLQPSQQPQQPQQQNAPAPKTQLEDVEDDFGFFDDYPPHPDEPAKFDDKPYPFSIRSEYETRSQTEAPSTGSPASPAQPEPKRHRQTPSGLWDFASEPFRQGDRWCYLIPDLEQTTREYMDNFNRDYKNIVAAQHRFFSDMRSSHVHSLLTIRYLEEHLIRAQDFIRELGQAGPSDSNSAFRQAYNTHCDAILCAPGQYTPQDATLQRLWDGSQSADGLRAALAGQPRGNIAVGFSTWNPVMDRYDELPQQHPKLPTSIPCQFSEPHRRHEPRYSSDGFSAFPRWPEEPRASQAPRYEYQYGEPPRQPQYGDPARRGDYQRYRSSSGQYQPPYPNY